MMRKEKKRKTAHGMVELPSTLLSPQSMQEPSHQPKGAKKLANVLQKQISKMHESQKEKVIKNVLYNLYGRNNPINYKRQFNFQQNWQASFKQQKIQGKYNVLNTQNNLFISMHFTICIIFGIISWFFSIYRLFGIESYFGVFMGIVLAAQLIDVILQQFLRSEVNEQNIKHQNSLTVKDYLKLYYRNIAFVVYLVFLLVQELSIEGGKCKWLYFIDLFFVWLSYSRFKQLYSAIKIRILASKFRNELMIIQLFAGCIQFVHIFAIILYLVSLSNSEKNWTQKISYFAINQFAPYVYSIYFSCTTALTVGYGDITPQNLFQIVTILCVQILGLINIGYIVSQIGRILSKINEKQELLHNDISQAEKITKNFELPPNIANKMKTFVINNQQGSNTINVEQQENFMKRLNDQIRHDVHSYHNFRVVKTSVFFLCHWTKKFQNKIATKLTRCLYSPQQNINQIHGKQKLFILTRGKMQIQACNVKNPSSELTRCMGHIQFDDKKDVQFNVYGYSALISGLVINLKAIFKDYSICYQIDKDDMLKIARESENDFQYYHQIKGRIEQSRFKQVFQAPGIANTRQHFIPNPYFILKNDRKKQQKKNQRKNFIRNPLKQKLVVFSHQGQLVSDISSDEQTFSKEVSNEQANLIDRNTVLSKKERQRKYKGTVEGSSRLLIVNRKYRCKNIKKTSSLTCLSDQEQRKIKALQHFEQFKNYQHYFPKFNFETMSRRYIKIMIQKNNENKIDQVVRVVQNLGCDIIDKLFGLKKRAFSRTIL